MEADRGQADIATVLSVGVHTSPCTGPGPDPITQTHTHTHTVTVTSATVGQIRVLGEAVAVALRLCGTLTYGVFHK